MKSIAQFYYDRLLSVGSLTLTFTDKYAERMLARLNSNGIKYEIRRYHTFAVVVLKTRKGVYHKNKNNQSLRENTQKKKEKIEMKNWTVKEAAVVIGEGKDVEAIKEIVKHFPMFSVIIAAKNFDAAMAAMPESLTVRKIENGLNAGTSDASDTDDTEEVDDAEETESGEDMSSMTKDQLIAMCDKKGIRVQRHQKPKQYYIDMLNKSGDDEAEEEVEEKPAKAKGKPAKAKVEEADEEEEVEEDPVALYKKCKKAGLNVKPRQSAKYYNDALAKAAEEESDDDWAEDEEVEEKPAKGKAKSKPAKAEKPATKAKAKAKVEDDEEESDDDDWDI